MNDPQAKEFIEYVLELRNSGVAEDKLIAELKKKFDGTDDDFEWAIEMMNTGAFRAAIMSSGQTYPLSNLNIEDDSILKIAFKMAWIDFKGEQHFKENYQPIKRRIWRFWK